MSKEFQIFITLDHDRGVVVVEVRRGSQLSASMCWRPKVMPSYAEAFRHAIGIPTP